MSEIDWIPKIPWGWKAVPLWALYRRGKRVGFESEELLSVYRDFGVVPKGSRNDNFNKASEDLSAYQLVEPGDLVLNKMKAWQGSIAISEHRGIVSPAYFVYRPEKGPESDSRYVHWLLRSPLYINEYARGSKGIRVNQWDLDPDWLKTLRVLLPPKEEQCAIARFLDYETARIDTLIAKQERLIELLKEKRQAVISTAVTAGSGGRTQLRYHAEILPGYAFPSDSYSQEPEHVRLLRGVNVGVGSVNWDEAVYWSSSKVTREIERFALEAGDLVFGMDRPWIAAGCRVAIVGQDDLPAMLLQRVCRVRPMTGLSVDFLSALLSSVQFRQFIECDLTGVGVPHISAAQIQSFRFRLPNAQELADWLLTSSRQLISIEKLIEKSMGMIEMLRERRTALISAAVTGKIDVRNWQPPEPEKEAA